jgi:class 3 adenylate cyclase/tRNA A-37 threonylcarbamoyl transferase component Bud32
VYSFGIIMWELLTREQPYAGVSTAAIAVGVIRDSLRPTDLQASDSGAQRHVEFEGLMAECWHSDPSVRPSFLEVMSRLSAMSEDMTGHDINHSSMTTSGSSSSTYMGQGSASFYNTAKHSASAGSTASSTSSSHMSSRSGGSAKAAAAAVGGRHGQRGVGQPPAPAVDGPLTVVFTDVAQAAQLWEAEPQAMREAVAMHNELLRRLIKQHRGYESVFLHRHNTGAAGGEGYFCVVFGRPLDALRWCDEVQRELVTLEWPPALLGVLYAREEVAGVADGVLFRGPRVRMGAHHGPISRTRDPVSNRFEYFGAAVKVATELTLRAEGGHVLVSDAVISAVEALSEPVTNGNGGDDDVTLDKDRALYGRHRFQQVGAVEVMVANGGSMLEVEVHDMRLSGLEDRCQAWEQAESSSNHTSARSGTTTHTGGSSTTSSGGGDSSRPRLLARPDEASYIGSSNACRWIIPFEDLAIQEAHVGQGSYGFVSQGRWKGVDVAVKRFVKQRLDEDTMLRFREEAALLAELRHPNVVLFIGACVRSPNICIVTEWIPKGSLRDVLADGSVKLSWATRLNVVKGIALGLAYLHSQQPAPILHRDLKSSNVLVDESWNAKIADFGLARMKQENATMTRCGTPAWIAPEVVMRERYTEKADLYSLGMVMWEVATRKLPFAGENLAKTAVDVVEGKRPPVPANAPKAYVALMTACWHRKPHKRPSAEQVCRTIESWLDNTASGEVNLV